MNTFEVVDIVLDKEFIFQGLNIASINYLRENGLWMPVSKELLDANTSLIHESGHVYAHYGSSDLMYFIVEKGEFLTGSVYTVIDQDKPLTSSNFTHQYALEDGSLVRENIQHISSGIMFLELIDEEGNVISSWSDSDIEYIISHPLPR